MPESVQCAVFSATMPLEVLEVTEHFMRDPIRKNPFREQALTLDGIKRLFISIEEVGDAL